MITNDSIIQISPHTDHQLAAVAAPAISQLISLSHSPKTLVPPPQPAPTQQKSCLLNKYNALTNIDYSQMGDYLPKIKGKFDLSLNKGRMQ